MKLLMTSNSWNEFEATFSYASMLLKAKSEVSPTPIKFRYKKENKLRQKMPLMRILLFRFTNMMVSVDQTIVVVLK